MATIYSGTNDGWCATGLVSDWATARSHAGALVDLNNSSDTISVIAIPALGSIGLRRAFFEFDTSGISEAPSAASINIYGNVRNSADIILVRGTQSSTLVAGDFNSLHNCSTELAASDGSGAGTLAGVSGLTYSSEISTWSTSGYNEIALNSTALSDIASLDTFKVCMMEYDHDYLDATVTSRVDIGNYWAEQSGTSKDPYLDYTAASAATDNSVFFGCNF